jgi:hypothetical protein
MSAGVSLRANFGHNGAFLGALHMKPRLLAASAVWMVLVGGTASAQTLKPGLWEMSHKTQTGSGEMEKAMAEAQKQMANLPPEQRKMMQDMMAKQGVSMSAGGGMAIKVCLTKEMIERNEVAGQQSQQGDCKSTSSPRAGNSMKVSFSCSKPPSSGEGQVTFVSPEAYSMQMTVNTTVAGKSETLKMDSGGKWLGSDCGSVKPPTMPK